MKEKQSTNTKAKWITQVHGSLEGTEIFAKVRELETIKQMELDEKLKRDEKKEFAISSYFRCKIVWNCTKISCEPSRLKQCELFKEIKKVVVAENSVISMSKNNYDACGIWCAEEK